MAATPAQQVFFTAELLEEILLRARPRDVLVLQRVCKSWKNTVEGSRKLQKLLFFLPAGEIKDYGRQENIRNPMVSLAYEHLCAYVRDIPRQATWAKVASRAHRKDNPIFYKNASLKRMYLFQPPFRRLSTPSRHWLAPDKIEYYKGGVTIWDFIQHCEEDPHTCKLAINDDLGYYLGGYQAFEGYEQLEWLSKPAPEANKKEVGNPYGW